MIHLRKQWRAPALLLLLAVPVCATAQADRTSRTREALGDIQQRIQVIERAMARTRKGRRDVFDELARSESSLAKMARSQRRLEEASARLQRRRSQLEAEQLELQRSIKTQRAQLARSLRVAFAIGRQDTLKLILNGERAGDVPRLLRYQEFVSRSQRARIRSLESSLREMEGLRVKLDEHARTLAALSREQAEELRTRDEERQRRRLLLARIDSELGDAAAQLARLKRDSEELQRLIRKLEQAISDIPADQEPPRSFASLRGKLPWPVRGRALNRYAGERGESGVKWQGVVLAAALGTEVRAIANGRVVYASELRGFGNVIILEHGKGYMSLYGHTETPLREPGDWVNPGDVIATVGDSGGARRSGLYFEIRHKGEPQDPGRWCSAKAQFQAAL